MPVVNATDPLNNDTGVALNKVVAITFSKAMDRERVNTSTFAVTLEIKEVNAKVAHSETTNTTTITT